MNSLPVEVIAFLAVFLGSLCRTLLPFLQKAKENPNLKFELRYLVTFAITIVESLIASLLLFGSIPTEILTGALSQFLVFITAFSWSYTSNDVINRIAT